MSGRVRRALRSYAVALLLACAGRVAAGDAVLSEAPGPLSPSAHTVARRIVALAPHLVEIAYAAGAGDRLVGASAASDYPPAALTLPRVADASGVDLERLLLLRPDLVLAWRSGNPARSIDAIRRLRIPVFLSEPLVPADIPRLVEAIGRLAGTEPVASVVAAGLATRWQRLGQTYAGRPPVRVFFEIWHAPPTTVGEHHLIAAALRACGAQVVLADARLPASSVDPEAVIAADPDLILAAWGESDAEVTGAWADYAGLRAVQRHRVFRVDADRLQRASPRFVDGAEILCALIERERARR